MPNKTIYIADEDIPIFQKAQEVAGESISKVIAQALRQYVIQKDLEGTELKECEAWKGYIGNMQKVRFIGNWLSEATVADEYGQDYKYNLYHTRKGKFLLQTEILPPPEAVDALIQGKYEIIDDFNKLYAKHLPQKLIKDAEEHLGKSHIKFLDI